MKSKITRRLIAYFSIALLLFSLVVGIGFSFFFTRYTREYHEQELQGRAGYIAENIAAFLENAENTTQGPGHGGRRGNGSGGGIGNGMGAYIRFLGDIALADVWVIDANRDIVAEGQHEGVLYSELPVDAEADIARAFQGETAISEGFSDVLGTQVVTVSAPVFGASAAQTPIGVVLLHAPVSGISGSITSGLRMLLLSMALALIVAVFAAIVFSARFTKPVNIMRQNTARLAAGDYAAKNALAQADEIGDLARDLDTLAGRLQEAARQSEKLESLRRNFISNISHELRTPVTVLRGSLEALHDGVVDSPERIREYHEQMLRESRHLERLVSDLLELSRLQSMDFAIEKRAVDLSAVLSDVLMGMRHLAEKKNVQLLAEEPASFAFQGDYDRLRQMLMVVLDNAIKFSPENAAVTIKAAPAQGGYDIMIQDAGPGIPAGELPYIFDRFHRARTGNAQGSGLGLSIAKEIAARHDIEITVESKPGETRFSFHF